MNELTTTQKAIIETAAARTDGAIYPIPEGMVLRGGALQNVIDSMRAKGLIQADSDFITEAGYCAIGLEPPWKVEAGFTTGPGGEANDPTNDCVDEAKDFATAGIVSDASLESPADISSKTGNDFETDVIVAEQAMEKSKPRRIRDDTKKAKVIEMLKRPEGATAAQIAEATGWANHTVRGFLSIAKKKLGLDIRTNRVRMVGPNQQGSPGSFTTYFAG
ncbi:MAG: DUF3489 domain-containing protein [Nitrospirae bacterium]|nr:DUF3489 domain-containing protein [Magnetococcales bacterium]HAT50423.1 hypothetical protein [Alphaproteobacteria bacterium]